MARTTVPYVVPRKNKNGGVRWYWRPSPDLQRLGFTVARLCADQVFMDDGMVPGAVVEASRPFTAHARAVLKGRLPPPGDGGGAAAARHDAIAPGSLAAMFRAYKRDETFSRKSAATRADYDKFMVLLEAWAGERMPMAVTPADCLTLYRMLRDGRGKRTASYTLAVLRLTMRWGRRKGFPNNDPAAALDMEGSGGNGRVWSQAAIDAAAAFFDAEGRHSLATAVMLNGWIGLREADLIGLRRSQISDGWITLTPGKTRNTTGKKVYLPVGSVPRLAERIAAETARLDSRSRDAGDVFTRMDSPLIVSEETGRVYGSANFRTHILRMRRTLGAAGLLAWRTAGGLTPEAAADLISRGGEQTWTGADWTMWEYAARPDHWKADRPFNRMPTQALDRLFDLDPRAAADPRMELIALQFMHLRHTAVTRMSEGGATAQQVASVTGHSIKWIETLLSIYGVPTRKLAEQAFTLRLAAEGES